MTEQFRSTDRSNAPLPTSVGISTWLLAAAVAFACLFCALAPPAARAQRDLKDIPLPDPELERKSFIVDEGFEVNLYASDPLIAKPIQMNFDSRGRLWIASSEVYPHLKPGQEATDKILVLEDRNGDGQADKTTVFADDLLIPTGVLPDENGCYVANSTELLYLEADADSRDELRLKRKRIVLSGFGTEDTHHLLHTLRWGQDGCIYMNQSIYIHSHIETPYGVRRLNGGGIWRFRPETLRLDVFCEGFVNPWGHHFDRWGQSFATDGAYREGINYVFPGAVFVTAPGAKRFLSGLNPGSPKHCGLEIVSGRHLPDSWQGSMITNDFRAHRVCRFEVTEDGAGYASRQQNELIKSSHVAFRPIDVKMGPDGAIYIADWYNPIIQHGEVDFRDPRRDHIHGRIWRVTARDRPLVEQPDLPGMSVSALLDHLKRPEKWQRLHAKLILKERHLSGMAVAPVVADWLAGLDADEPAFEHHRLEALWLYQAMNSPNFQLLAKLLRSEDHRVRAAAVRVAADWKDRMPGDPLAVFRAGVTDSHPRVRLEAVRGLAGFAQAEAAEIAALALDQPLDRFLDFALWRTMRNLQPHWLAAVRNGTMDFGGRVEHLTFALRAVDSPEIAAPLLKLVRTNKLDNQQRAKVLALVASLGGPAELQAVWEMVLDPESRLADRVALLDALVAAAEERKVRPAGDLDQLQRLLDSENVDLRSAAVRAAGVWRLESQRDRIAGWALDDQQPPALRSAAIRALASLGGAASIDRLVEIAGSAPAFDTRRQAVAALAGVAPQRAARLAVDLLVELPKGEDPATVLATLLARKSGPAALAKALQGRTLKADVAKLAVRAARASGSPSDELIAAIQRAGNLDAMKWKLTPELLEELVSEVNEQGDPRLGEEVYRRKELQCQKCHAIGGAGGVVGPDLVSIGASAQVDYLIESLIEPNKKVKENFHSLVVVKDDGTVATGIPVRSNDSELVLRDAEGRLVTIRKDAIDETAEGRSLMPDGAAESLTRDELVHLVRFLAELGKLGDFAVGKARLARTWQTLIWTRDAHHRLNRTSFDTAATDDPALTWQPVYSRVSGELPVDELPTLKPHQETPPTSFVRCEIEVTTPGQVRLLFNSTQGLEFWLDGKPTPIADNLSLAMTTGRHTLTFAIDRSRRSEPLRLELGDAPGSPAQAQLVGGK